MVVQSSNGIDIHIDREDFEKVRVKTWRVDSNGYVVNAYKENGKARRLYLHRFIMGNPESLVDHKELPRTNNKKSNLRLATYSQNRINTNKTKGYFWREKYKKFEVGIIKNKKKIYIGRFETEQLAAQAYRSARQTLFGAFSPAAR